MRFELSINELGEKLKKIGDNNDLSILIKSELSGGWMTLTGDAKIVKIPDNNASGCRSKKDNIIHIQINDNAEQETLVKLTGASNKKFNVDISAGRYRELSNNNLTINQIKVNENETKIRIDENIIFIVKNNVDNILQLVK